MSEVFVLSFGEYEDVRVRDVFTTLAAAQKAGGGRWETMDDEGYWFNDGDWEGAAKIDRVPLDPPEATDA